MIRNRKNLAPIDSAPEVDSATAEQLTQLSSVVEQIWQHVHTRGEDSGLFPGFRTTIDPTNDSVFIATTESMPRISLQVGKAESGAWTLTSRKTKPAPGEFYPTGTFEQYKRIYTLAENVPVEQSLALMRSSSGAGYYDAAGKPIDNTDNFTYEVIATAEEPPLSSKACEDLRRDLQGLLTSEARVA